MQYAMSEYEPGMWDTDDRIYVFESSDKKFVGQNACRIFEAKETVISEDCANTHEVRM